MTGEKQKCEVAKGTRATAIMEKGTADTTTKSNF